MYSSLHVGGIDTFVYSHPDVTSVMQGSAKIQYGIRKVGLCYDGFDHPCGKISIVSAFFVDSLLPVRLYVSAYLRVCLQRSDRYGRVHDTRYCTRYGTELPRCAEIDQSQSRKIRITL